MAGKKKFIVKLKAVRIDKNGYQLVASGKINGKKARFVIDTGASQTVFDKKRMSNFLGHDKFEKSESLSTGLGTNSMVSHLVIVPGFSIGDFEISKEKMVLLDLSHVNEFYSVLKLKPIDGVIGGDVLKRYRALLDYEKRELILRKK